MGFFGGNSKAAEARRKKVEAYNKKRFSLFKKPQSEAAKRDVAPQQVEEPISPPTPVVTKSASKTEERTLQDKMNSFADNIVNPENHPEQPVTKQASSDEPTEDDDEESQEDLDNDDKVDAAESREATSPTTSPTNLIDQVKSDESTKIETIPPPNSLKPMDREEMEKFIEEQRAQQNTGLLCGCI